MTLRIRPHQANWDRTFEQGEEDERNMYSRTSIAFGESSPLSSIESTYVRSLLLLDKCLTLDQAAKIMDRFLDQPSISEQDSRLELVESWERHNWVCSRLGMSALAWADPAESRVTEKRGLGASSATTSTILVIPLSDSTLSWLCSLMRKLGGQVFRCEVGWDEA